MKDRRIAVLLGLGALAFAPLRLLAQAESAPLEEIIVTGEFPGPGMWKITRSDDHEGHVLWIVGDPPPLPKRMTWKSREVVARALESQEILNDVSLKLEPDEPVGILRGLTLLPAALKARKSPGGATLQTLLPPELYARWLVQKKLYLGRESGMESWRPIFAADKLRRAAMDELDLRERGAIFDVIGPLAKKHRIAVESPTLRFTFKASELRAKLREFSKESLADVECFARTLDLTEALSHRDVEAARAHAWATADLEQLESLPPLPNPMLPCAMAVMNSQLARETIPRDVREQLARLWVSAAVRSLADHQTTLAIVPLTKLTASDGYLARLRESGLTVEAPR